MKFKEFKKNGFVFTYVPQYKVVGIDDGEYDIVITNIVNEEMAKAAVNMLTGVMTQYQTLNPATFYELVEIHKEITK